MVSLGANKLGAFAGVVVTASHNPPAYNGFQTPKRIRRTNHSRRDLLGGIPYPGKTEIPETDLDTWAAQGLLEWVDLEEMYYQHVLASFDMDLINNSGIRLGYDAMYGASQRIALRLLSNIVPLHVDDNPGFHRQAPEPIHRNLTELSELIKVTTVSRQVLPMTEMQTASAYDEQEIFCGQSPYHPAADTLPPSLQRLHGQSGHCLQCQR